MVICLFHAWCYGDLLVFYLVLWLFACFIRGVVVICLFSTWCYGDLLVFYLVLW